MVVEGEFVVDGDAEVFSCLCGLEGGIVDVVGVVEGFCFVCDAHDLALVGVKFHFVVSFPGLEGVQICLEGVLVFG